jgi:hypothetical protein
MSTKDNAKATGYPKAHFATVESLRKHYECYPTDQVRDDLVIYTVILAEKLLLWALGERVKDDGIR